MSQLNLHLQAKQTQALLSKATEILYGGAAFGGKSHLMRVAAINWCATIPGLQVYLFRRTLPDLWKNHMEGPSSFPNMLAPWVKAGWAKVIYSKPAEIRFWNGSKIFLCHCQHEKDVFDFQGAEIHVLLIDELTHFSVSIYKYLRGRVRMVGIDLPKQYAGMFPRILVGANPGGVGHNWVRSNWITGAKPMEIRQMPASEAGMLRQYIPAKMHDNQIGMLADPTYDAKLEGLGNPALVQAMRDGNWNIVSGGAFDDVWCDRIILPRFQIPASWRVDRSFDWGSSKPFSVLWWGQADGTEAKLPGDRTFCPPRGTLILAHEWYGTKGDNVGLKLGASKVAEGIVTRESELVREKWVTSKPLAGPADNSISDVKNADTPTVEKLMADKGVRWTKSDKAPGSRKNGLELMRERFIEASKETPESPALFVMDHCRNVIDHWPVLPRDKNDPDDVDSAAEDHDYDAGRYRVLAGKPGAMSITLGFAQ